MGVFSSIETLDRDCTLPVNLSLGMFDGVHVGHQQVLESAVTHARRSKGYAVAFTFPCHPAKYLRPERAPPLLMSPREKVIMLESFGIDHVILREFDDELAEIPAAEFPTFLKDRISSLHSMSVGRNFRFGKGREGDSSFLKKIGESIGLSVTVVESKVTRGNIVSSSRIREALGIGDIEKVNDMLGREYLITGEVFSGKKMGRSIGFPTMNLDWNPEALPAYGVYAGIVKHRKFEKNLPAVANYGLRPTFEHKASTPKLEIHSLIDLDTEIWGCGSKIEMALQHFIRPEKKFDTVDDLKTQINIDKEKAKELVLPF